MLHAAQRCRRQYAFEKPAKRALQTDAYLVHQGPGTLEFAFALGEELRAAGLAAVLHAGGGSFKAQMKKADASGATLALIVGENELAADAVAVKPLRDGRPQRQVPRAGLAAQLNALLKGN